MQLKHKSDINFKSGVALIDMGNYAPSVHCFYYSCFQLSKSFLNDFCGMSYAKQDAEAKGKDSHKFIINTTKDAVNRPVDFDRTFRHIRHLRAKSDYKNQDILKSEADQAKKYANVILNIIKDSWI